MNKYAIVSISIPPMFQLDSTAPASDHECLIARDNVRLSGSVYWFSPDRSTEH